LATDSPMSAPSDATTGASSVLSVANLDTPEKLVRKFTALKQQRFLLDQQWRLNLAFYNGKQWSYIDRLGRLQSLSTSDGDKPRHIVRLVSNQIMSGSHSLLSKMTKTKPIISATPGSASDHDVKAAQMAEDLLEYWWQDMHLDDALEEVLLWCIIAGQGYWKITWDPHAGKAMKFLLDQQGKPIVDDAQATQYKMQASQAGVQPEEKTVYLGDIKVEVMSPFSVYIDPTAKVFKDAKYAICVHYLDPDEIWGRWKVRVQPDAVAAEQDQLVPFDNSSNALQKTVKAVHVGYFLPTPALPNGRYVSWITGPNRILEDQPWPYSTNELPIVKFPGLRVPGRIYDSSVVEHAIPLQKELNKTLSQIVEYKNLTIKPRVWAPAGSLRQRITNEAGAVYEYTPVGGLKPEVEALPTMPPYVFNQLEDISARLKDAFFMSEVDNGSVPPNVEAGVAIDLLQEQATDRLAPTIKLIESALARAGQQMLSLAQKYYIEPRLMKIRGSGGSSQVMRFTNADIDGGITVHTEAGSGLPRTRAGRQARIESYISMGVLRPDQAWKYLDMADMKTVSKLFQSDEDMAYREHEKLLQGVPLNPMAIQTAMQAVAQGINPQTGQPFMSAQEAMQYVQDAALEPQPFENWQVHLDTHALFMKSVEFEMLQQDAQQRFITHYQKTYDMARKLQPIPPAQPIKTSLQLRGSIGPTGAAEILGRSVPDITPETMSEPPLDTVVQGFDQNANDQQGQVQEVAQASVAQQEQANTAMQGIATQQKMAHAEEQHRQALSHKEQQHQEKLRQMRKPKPVSGG
jgi:hypothetical protein